MRFRSLASAALIKNLFSKCITLAINSKGDTAGCCDVAFQRLRIIPNSLSNVFPAMMLVAGAAETSQDFCQLHF